MTAMRQDGRWPRFLRHPVRPYCFEKISSYLLTCLKRYYHCCVAVCQRAFINKRIYVCIHLTKLSSEIILLCQTCRPIGPNSEILRKTEHAEAYTVRRQIKMKYDHNTSDYTVSGKSAPIVTFVNDNFFRTQCIQLYTTNSVLVVTVRSTSWQAAAVCFRYRLTGITMVEKLGARYIRYWFSRLFWKRSGMLSRTM